MNILITGATGKIGQMLINELNNNESFNIFVIAHKNNTNIAKGIQIQICDISSINSLRNIIDNFQNIDVVLHMAAITHTNNRNDYYKINVEGTKNIIKISEELGIKKIIFISSRVACKGGGDYSESKLEAENEIKKSNMQWLILAFGEIYSINGKDEINRIYKIIKSNYFIPIIGNGNYKLAPLFIEDAVKVIINTLKNNKLNNRRYTICGPEELSYNELINLILSFNKLKRLKIYIPLFFLKLFFRLLSIFKIKKIAYDQLDRLMVKKPSDISDAKRDLDFNPIKISDALKLFR